MRIFDWPPTPPYYVLSTPSFTCRVEAYFVIVVFLTPICLQVTGKCGSVVVRLIPAPRGTGIVSAPVPKKLLQMAGIEDCYTSARGQTATLGNFGEYTLRYGSSQIIHFL